MSCPWGHDDGAYLLGALAPRERVAFEEHLPACGSCTRAVRDLGGLPGLLARVPATTLEAAQARETTEPAEPAEPAEPESDELPPTLLSGLGQRVRRHERRRTALAAVLGALLAAAAVGGVALVTRDDPEPAAEAPAPARPMRVVGDEPVRARVAVTSVPWGTRLDLTCRYAASDPAYATGGSASYVLVVHRRDGGAEQAASWHALPGASMKLAAATAVRAEDIAWLEVRTADGEPVLELRS